MLVVLCGLAGLLACRGEMPPPIRGQAWPEANQLFRQDPNWMGGDGAYSVDLGNQRVLWQFGDSFVRTPSQDGSYMVRNSVAVQTGLDPTRAFIRFYWQQRDGHPASFLPELGNYWYWPNHGIRLEDKLLLFYARLYQAGSGKWGFRYVDWSAFVVDNPDDEPSVWRMSEAKVPPDEHEVQLATAVWREGDVLYLMGGAFNRAPPAIHLARVDCAQAQAGDLRGLVWWTGAGWGPRDQRRAVIDFGAPELSMHFSTALGEFVMVQTAGAGATTLAVRTAPRPEGPWSDPRDVLRPPESYYDDTFVYAGKGHPELQGADLIATYVPTLKDDVHWAEDDTYYHPYFAKLSFP